MRRLRPPVISVDVPSGWPVDEEAEESVSAPAKTGDEPQERKKRFVPEVLLSLTAPKSGIRSLVIGTNPVRHFIGGRFIPKSLEHQYALALPTFPGDEQIVEVTGWEEMSLEQAKHLSQQEMEASASGVSNGDELDAFTVAPARDAATHLGHQADTAQRLEAGAADDEQKTHSQT